MTGNHGRAAGLTRRRFLSHAAGAAGAAVLPVHTLAQHPDRPRAAMRADRFSRLFDLPPFADATPQVQAALMELGAPGGPMDARDPLHEGAIRLITHPELSPRNRDNAATSAGLTFLGQFLDHDLTFDAASRLGEPARPERSPNARTAAFDLDSVYGGGPTVSPELYDPADPARFRVDHGGQFEDVPRGPDGRAIIADPRNDDNLMISGLHAAFLLFHNRVVDMLREDGADRRLAAANRAATGVLLPEREEDDRRRAVFLEARRLVTWHYHWIDPARVPAADRRGRDRARHPHAGAAILPAAGRGTRHPGRVPGRRLPVRTQRRQAVGPRQPRRRRRPPVLWLRLRRGR